MKSIHKALLFFVIAVSFAQALPAQTIPGMYSDPNRTIMSFLSGSKPFENFLVFLKQTELTDSIRVPGPITVFAITNTASYQIPYRFLDSLRDSPGMLRDYFLCHILDTLVTADDLKKAPPAGSIMNSTKVILTLRGKKFYLDRAKLISTEIHAKNGILHILDAPLLPVDLKH